VSQNVERVRALFERFNETGEMDFSLADPELELHSRPDVPDSTVWRGIDGVRGFFARTAESFDPIRWEPLEFVEHGMHVVVRAHIVAYGATSGAPVEIDEFQLWTFRDALLVRLQAFPTIEEAYATAEELDRAES
jgi:ketosteroid isomerase-like protein